MPGWVTRQEAAQRAGVHYNTIRIWERSGLIRTQKRGARGVLSVDDLDRVVRERGASPAGTPSNDGSGPNIEALERRFEALLDGLEGLVASARAAQPRRRPGRPLGSRNKPKTETSTTARKAVARKPAKRAAATRKTRRRTSRR